MFEFRVKNKRTDITKSQIWGEKKQNLQDKTNLVEFNKQPTETSAYHAGWKFRIWPARVTF